MLGKECWCKCDFRRTTKTVYTILSYFSISLFCYGRAVCDDNNGQHITRRVVVISMFLAFMAHHGLHLLGKSGSGKTSMRSVIFSKNPANSTIRCHY